MSDWRPPQAITIFRRLLISGTDATRAGRLIASFVVAKDDVDEVVMMLHRELFGESAPSDIFVPTEVKAHS